MKKIAFIFGGISSEHEVSRISVTSILNNVDKSKYEYIVVGITKNGAWYKYTGDIKNIKGGEWEKDRDNLFDCVLSPDRRHSGFLVKKGDNWQTETVDVLFPVMHGQYGEDGAIQGLFKLSGIPFVGCDLISSANCMDKDITKLILTANDIPNSKWITVYEGCDIASVDRNIIETLNYPVFVKPANSGSSVGVGKAYDSHELTKCLEVAFKEDKKVIIEETIRGKEIECAVMGNDEPRAFETLGEVEPLRDVYDYEGKYEDNTTKLHIPARLEDEQVQAVRDCAIKAYRAMGCKGLSRVDFFVTESGIVLNEINTLPGFTNISMYPKLAMESGLSYSEVISKLIELAKN